MNLTEFYPTPAPLIRKMIEGIDFKKIQTVLEPSAGDGKLIDAVSRKSKDICFSYETPISDIDAVEINEQLRHILKGKNHRVIHDDFLTLETLKRYDLILMNPPFSNGDEHLLKALKMQEDGGMVVCILNAETLRNPYSNKRQELVRKLTDLKADIQYLQEEFESAERRTKVEVALIKVKIAKDFKNSIILENLQKAKEHQSINHKQQQVINGDFYKGMVERFNHEAKIGVSLIQEYEKQALFLNSNENNRSQKIIEIRVGNETRGDLINRFLKSLRYSYWNALFISREFTDLLTSNLQSELYSKLSELKEYDFTLYNILQLKAELSKHILNGVKETILTLFDEFSNKHHYAEYSKNIYLYNGWKTNKAWKINKKVIIPLNAFSSWDGRFEARYDALRKLADIEKALNYLDCGHSDNNNHIYLENALKEAEKRGQTSKIRTKYFLLTFYKKGTCHLEFLNEDLLKKFNLFGSQRKGWLPPGYGKKSYYDMDSEERAVVNEFEGMASYAQTVKNKEYFLVEDNQLLLSMSASA